MYLLQFFKSDFDIPERVCHTGQEIKRWVKTRRVQSVVWGPKLALLRFSFGSQEGALIGKSLEVSKDSHLNEKTFWKRNIQKYFSFSDPALDFI